ncbi:MAG: hypothetical protein GY816_18180, partial [Cytophagales bacterium]|nr:hypothetical protein [Cytophagales bacterium]
MITANYNFILQINQVAINKTLKAFVDENVIPSIFSGEYRHESKIPGLDIILEYDAELDIPQVQVSSRHIDGLEIGGGFHGSLNLCFEYSDPSGIVEKTRYCLFKIDVDANFVGTTRISTIKRGQLTFLALDFISIDSLDIPLDNS